MVSCISQKPDRHLIQDTDKKQRGTCGLSVILVGNEHINPS